MRKFLWLLLLVLFTGFIFFNSSMSAETSHNASSLLAQWLDSFYSAIGDPMPVDRLEARLRKLAHLAEFAMLAVIMVNTFIAWRISNRVASGYILFLVWPSPWRMNTSSFPCPAAMRRLRTSYSTSAASLSSGAAARYGCGARSS